MLQTWRHPCGCLPCRIIPPNYGCTRHASNSILLSYGRQILQYPWSFGVSYVDVICACLHLQLPCYNLQGRCYARHAVYLSRYGAFPAASCLERLCSPFGLVAVVDYCFFFFGGSLRGGTLLVASWFHGYP